jgi:hypothetical protein
MSSQYGRIAFGAVVAAMVFGRSTIPAHAEVAIEVYEGARPDEAAAIMPIVLAELGTQGTVADPRFVKTALRYPPRPAALDPTVTSAGLADELELGVKAYLRAEYEGAIVKLNAALARAYANPGVVVAAESTRTAMARALVGLALSYGNAGRTAEAVETMTAYIRSTNEPVQRRMLGPPGEQLYHQVRKSLEKAKRGSLLVNVSAPDAQIFVNALRQDYGRLIATDLLPGDYHVIVLAGQLSRRYAVTVRPEIATTLDIDWALDSALQISDQWVGLTLAIGESAPDYVGRVARRMGNQRTLIVLGLRRERDHLALVGTRYGDALSGYVARAGEVHVVHAGDEPKLRALARFLADGAPSPDVFVVGQRTPSRPLRWPAIPAGAAAVTGLGLGAYLLYIDGQPSCGGEIPPGECERTHGTKVSGVLVMTGGALAGVAAVWFLSRRPARRVPATAFLGVSRSGAVATLGWSF